MSSDARGSESDFFSGAEHESELVHDRDPDRRVPSLGDVHMITADGDNAAASVQQAEDGVPNEMNWQSQLPYTRRL